jgi:hypothetical protein
MLGFGTGGGGHRPGALAQEGKAQRLKNHNKPLSTMLITRHVTSGK